MSTRKYQICTHCIMDTSAPSLKFDSNGLCEYCINYKNEILPHWHTDKRGEEDLFKLAEKIKRAGEGKSFDCILGLSGGLDSSYTAYVAKEKMKLRPLLLHVDAGWNTAQAVGNIEKIVDGLKLDLHTEVINWEEMKDLQRAFLKAQISDQDLPQDAVFFSALYKFARQFKIKYILTGSNYSTENCHEPLEWGGYPGIDMIMFKDICKRVASYSANTLPLIDILVYKIYYRYALGMKVVKPLNLVSYVKKDAEELLQARFGWEKFLHKHHESRFTRFYEDYWMPRKFGFEKRRAHFSSLIVTGQMLREEALNRISHTELDEHFLKLEFEYVAKKLDLSIEELQQIFEGDNKTYQNYKNKLYLIRLGAFVMQWLGLEKRLYK